MHIERKSRFTDTPGEDYSSERRHHGDAQRTLGGNMPTGYYVIGVVGLLAIFVAIKLTPDLIRYMKMRSM